MSMDAKEKLRQQLIYAAGNVQYTYSAHWIIVNRLKRRYTVIKVCQIILTALSTAGIIKTISSGVSWLSWFAALSSAIALALNLYMLNFNLPDSIKNHKDAADELWIVREAYKHLLTDLDDIEVDQVRIQRDALTERVGEINKKYPGTDSRSFKKAQDDKGNYTFTDGEAEQLLNTDNRQE